MYIDGGMSERVREDDGFVVSLWGMLEDGAAKEEVNVEREFIDTCCGEDKKEDGGS